MKLHIFVIASIVACFFLSCQNREPSADRDIYSDTWVATDALGRTMPDQSQVGAVKTDQKRVVGIFYITWHGDQLAQLKPPYLADVTKVLKKDPTARLDPDHPLWIESSYHWGEPEMGYFLSKDEYVIRKDLSMLADAGVDVLIMDVTNAVLCWDEWDVVFSTMQKMKAEGNKVPKFCFWAFNDIVITVVQKLYEQIYKPEKYKDLWFYWDGKPLLLNNARPEVDAGRSGIKHPNPHYDPAAKTDPRHPHYGDPDFAEAYYLDYTKEVKAFFTLRAMWWGYYKWHGQRFVGTEDNWSFGYAMEDTLVSTMSPDQLVSKHAGRKEQAAVTPGQHASTTVGKSWTREHGEPDLNEYDLPVPTYVPWLGKTVENPEGYGIYFQQRWDEALASDPPFIYLNDWNEWTAGKHHCAKGETFPFMGRQARHFFVDQYNAEFNRSIQPMKDGYSDNYYMQMAQNIRKYKGVRPIPRLSGLHAVTIDGGFDDWRAVQNEYRDTIGDTCHRDYPGYGGLHYKNGSGRNDLIAGKVAVDAQHVYFYMQTSTRLTPYSDANWMLLLIDADNNFATGWYGYDYLVNQTIIDEHTTTLKRFDAVSRHWIDQAILRYGYASDQLELAIPRGELGLGGNAFTFDFHWADNPADLHSPISLCLNGDSAPNRRFNYRCIWRSTLE